MRKLLLVAIIAIIGAAQISPLRAASFEEGLDAFNSGDFSHAFSIWWRLSRQGDAKAQASLGFMYYSGKGVQRDDQQSLFWFRQAAEAGQPTAQFFLGLQYFYGRGVPRDLAQAYSWCDISLTYGYSQGLSCRDAVERKMTPDDERRASELSAEFFRTHSFRN
jgi:uncharacterized protein